MPYGAISADFFDHPKYLAVMERDPRGMALYAWSLAYANAELTDGFVSTIQVRRRVECEQPMDVAEVLVEVGLWERAEGGFAVHDFLDHNLSAEQVQRKREQATHRQARWRSGKRRGGDALVDASRNAAVDPAVRSQGGQTASPAAAPSRSAATEAGGSAADASYISGGRRVSNASTNATSASASASASTKPAAVTNGAAPAAAASWETWFREELRREPRAPAEAHAMAVWVARGPPEYAVRYGLQEAAVRLPPDAPNVVPYAMKCAKSAPVPEAVHAANRPQPPQLSPEFIAEMYGDTHRGGRDAGLGHGGTRNGLRNLAGPGPPDGG